MPDSAHESETPDLREQDGGSGIEALPGRISRYGKSKSSALDVADYMAAHTGYQALTARVRSCGDWLAFRHYYTIDEVRLHGARLCMKHLLCQLCASRRGAKALRAYLERWDVIRAGNPHLRPYLITFTVANGPDLLERFRHLHKAQRELWKRRQRKRGAPYLAAVQGAVWSYEFKRGQGSGLWHPHIHMIALADHLDGEDVRDGTLGALSAEWHQITGDSYMVNVKPISQEDPASGFIEVFKYAVKFSDQDPADTVHGWETLRGKRLLASAGLFRGVVVPEQLTDDALDLPYLTLFYRYLRGAGYQASRSPTNV